MNTNTTSIIWKDIPGFEGIYQVSNMGEVKSLARQSYGISKSLHNRYTRNIPTRILKPNHDKCGYVHYRLTNKDGKTELWKRTSNSRFNIFRLQQKKQRKSCNRSY